MDQSVPRWILTVAWVFLAAVLGPASAQEPLHPFVYAGVHSGTMEAVVSEVRDKLRTGGFDVVGGYSPEEGRHVLVATGDRLREPVLGNPRAAYGAVVRVGFSRVTEGVQVSYTNPVYFQHAYRIDDDFGPVLEGLGRILGAERFFGAKKGLTPERLRRYRYAVGMEYFDDPYELGSFPSHEAAVAALEQGLRERRSGVRKIYRLDLGPGITLYGVSFTGGDPYDRYRDERFHLQVVDTGPLKRVAYLPYEILIDGGRVEALHMRFRMAVHFPDTNMVGRNSFMKLRKAPGALGAALTDVVGAPKPKKKRGSGLIDYSDDEF